MQTSRYIVKRILLALVSLFAIITITYFLMNLMPGDPFMSEKASEENRAILIAKYGLDQPVYVQYGKYLENLLHGDMGTSYVLQKGRAVKDIIFESFQVSMGLGVRALLLAIVCGIILGCIAGLCKDKLPDAIIRVFSSIGISMPGYVIASGLMIFLAVNLKVLPVNYNKPGGWVMPMLTLAISMSAKYMRQVRAAVLEELNKDYVQGARARGIRESVILWKNVIKSAMLTIITLLALSIGSLLGGTAIIESIFMWDGVGKLAVDAITTRDYPMIQAYVVWMALIYVIVNLITDLLYHCLDPRIRLGVNQNG